MLPSSRADVTIQSGTRFLFDSGAGATGTVQTIGNYTFASPVSLTATELFFNLTGMTANATAVPSAQLQFYAWNSSNTGTIPIVIQTATVYPTYVLNVTSYSYSNPNITISTLLSNQTVTVDFNLLGGYPVKVYECTGTLTSAPTLVSNILRFTVTDSGASASTMTRIQGMGEAPYAFTQNGLVPSVRDAVIYVAGTDVVTVTGLGTWVLSFHQSSPGGDGVTVGSSPTVSVSSVLTVPQGKITDANLTVTLNSQLFYTLSKVTFNQSWIHATGLPKNFLPSTVGQKDTVPVTVDARNLAARSYGVAVTVVLTGTDQTVSTTQIIQVKVTPTNSTTPTQTDLQDQLLSLTQEQKILIVAGVVSVVAVGLLIRRKKRNEYG